MKNLVLVLLLFLCFDLSAQSDDYIIIKPSVASVKATKGETVHIIYRVKSLNGSRTDRSFPHQLKNLELTGWKLQEVIIRERSVEVEFDIVVKQIAERTSQCALKGILHSHFGRGRRIQEKIILKM